MKYCWLFLLFISATINCMAQSNPPTPVEKTFQSKFPGASNTVWVFNQRSDWEVTFTMSNHNVWAFFYPNGKWIETNTAIEVSDLPPRYADTIKNKFKEWEIYDLKKVDRFDELTSYKVILILGDALIVNIIKAHGSIATGSGIILSPRT